MHQYLNPSSYEVFFPQFTTVTGISVFVPLSSFSFSFVLLLLNIQIEKGHSQQFCNFLFTFGYFFTVHPINLVPCIQSEQSRGCLNVAYCVLVVNPSFLSLPFISKHLLVCHKLKIGSWPSVL